jgi:hypothetical protein
MVKAAARLGSFRRVSKRIMVAACHSLMIIFAATNSLLTTLRQNRIIIVLRAIFEHSLGDRSGAGEQQFPLLMHLQQICENVGHDYKADHHLT